MAYLEQSFEFEITKNTEKQIMLTDTTDAFISEMVAFFLKCELKQNYVVSFMP